MGDPSIRVHNASIKFSLQLADMISFDNPENPLPDGFGYSFHFPDSNIVGLMQMNRYKDSVAILVCTKKMSSDRLHSVIMSPPDATKEGVIKWLREEASWSLIEEKWKELCSEAEED